MEKSSIPSDAGQAILKEGIRIKIPFIFGIKIRLTIRPLHPGTIVKASLQIEKMKELREEDNMLSELLRTGKNLKYHSAIVAIAVLNNPIKLFFFRRILTSLIIWGTKDNAELEAFLNIVYKQMDTERFFFITIKAQGMNMLKRKEPANTKVETQSGAR